MIAKPIPPGYAFDTSEGLVLAQYQFMWNTLGCRSGGRYVPLSGAAHAESRVVMGRQMPAGVKNGILTQLQDGTAAASPIISPAELHDALSIGFGMTFIQFARSGNWSIATGLADGQAAAVYILETLKADPKTTLWFDIDVIPVKQQAVDYCNSLYQGAVKYGMAATSPGGYFEPGFILNASERYSLINWHRYYITAANDPNKWVQPRGGQVIQAWASPRGEYFPLPGLVIDGDLVQVDYFGDSVMGAYASAA